MKRFAILFILLFTWVLAGCASLSGEIAALSRGEASGVFSEVKEGNSPSPDSADIVLKASIKTHLEGYYPFESKQSPHGKREYPFVINGDGQAVTWNVEGAGDSVVHDERSEL